MKEYLTMITEIKTVAVATINGDKPEVRMLDILLEENDMLFFTTASGKPFSAQLKLSGKIAITTMTPDKRMIRLWGKVQTTDLSYKTKIIEKHPEFEMISKLMGNETAEIFSIYDIVLEVFDQSKCPSAPLDRESYAFGDAIVEQRGYCISATCTNCGICASRCPMKTIYHSKDHYLIDQSHCLQCGLCTVVCPHEAVINLAIS